MVNSNLPETGELAKAMDESVEGEVVYTDCDFVDPAADERDALALGLAETIASGKVRPGVFADNVFFDMNVPEWRYQLQGVDTLANALAADITPGSIESVRIVPTLSGFVLELATREPKHTSRQLYLVETRGGLISEVTMYCTGDWDAQTEARQRAEAPMIRPA